MALTPDIFRKLMGQVSGFRNPLSDGSQQSMPSFLGDNKLANAIARISRVGKGVVSDVAQGTKRGLKFSLGATIGAGKAVADLADVGRRDPALDLVDTDIFNLKNRVTEDTFKPKGLAQRVGRAVILGPGEEIQQGLQNKGVSPLPAFAIGLAADIATPGPGEFKGARRMTIETLELLKGRKVVSKQFITDLSKRFIKKEESRLVREVADEFDGPIPVQEFADKIESRLVPLDTVQTNKFEQRALQGDTRGPVSKYQENIYQSPIKNNAGNIHFPDVTDNYFAHTRIEDMADGSTRRVIELQSDLFQKGRFEEESTFFRKLEGDESLNTLSEKTGETTDVLERRLTKEAEGEIAPLTPYRNTWWQRITREEVRTAAIDGKTTLRFPTGETIMKVEGLGDNTRWRTSNNGRILEPGELKVGQQVNSNGQSEWIITDVLKDGKFKAVPKEFSDAQKSGIGRVLKDIRTSNINEQFDISGNIDTSNPIYKFYEDDIAKFIKNKFGAKRITDEQGIGWFEVDVKKEVATDPVRALATVPLITGLQQDGLNKENETKSR